MAMGVAAVTMITGVAVVADAINGGLPPPPGPTAVKLPDWQ